MQTDNLDDFLFFLVIVEGVASLVCTYDLVLISLSGGFRERLVPHAVAFVVVAGLLLLTAALADHRQRSRGLDSGERSRQR